MGSSIYLLLLEYETMKTYIVKIKHLATGNVYTVQVLAKSLVDAEYKAGQWPYSNDSFVVEMSA
jgi:hypothetical protein